jgi:hypothetical protein
MDKSQYGAVQSIPDFDVLSEDPERTVLILRERLEELGFKNVKTVHHPCIDDVIPAHIQILVGKESMAFIFKPIACYSYNTVEIGNKQINIATINTMLSFFLAFIYADRPYFNSDRILCMAQFLFDVEQKNRLNQNGLLKRFSIQCYGKQPTLESIRAEKAEKFKELIDKRNTKEWNEWFFKYSPNAEKNPVLPSPDSKKRSLSSPEPSNKSPYLKSFIDPRSYEKKTNPKRTVRSRPRRRRRKTRRRTLLDILR